MIFLFLIYDVDNEDGYEYYLTKMVRNEISLIKKINTISNP
jgi:hypothetical protein